MAYSVWIAFVVCLVLDLIVSCVSDKYPSGLYTLLEHMQLVTIMPLAGSCFSSEVNGFSRLVRYSLLSFDFIEISSSYSQDNAYMKLIGFESSSTISNISSYLFIGLFIIFAEMFIFKMYRIKYPLTNESNLNTDGRIFKCTSRIKKWIPLGGPIRYLMLGVLLISITSLDELNNYSNRSYRWSWWITLGFIIFILAFCLTIVYLILSRDIADLYDSSMFNEIVNGLKDNKISKLYPIMFLFNRILITMFLMIDMGLSTENKLISLICFQSVYLILLIIVRPYNSIKANLVKVLCEM